MFIITLKIIANQIQRNQTTPNEAYPLSERVWAFIVMFFLLRVLHISVLIQFHQIRCSARSKQQKSCMKRNLLFNSLRALPTEIKVGKLKVEK